ncbi:MAG: FAD-binding domain-containing protein, partial [Henriciella sp.]|nr:FAD-binding domain-containing protein [Henriciella sp.]
RWHNLMAQPRLTTPETIPASDIPLPAWPLASDTGLKADPCPQRQIGGRRAAITLLKSFNERRGEPYRRAMSSPLTAVEACSRLSPHLAYGTLSMRETWQAASAARDIHAADGRKTFAASLDSFIARLHWHCHFIQQFESEAGLEHNSRDPAFNDLRDNPAPDDARLLDWYDGQTGFPFVDACMRALRETGWLNFKMRAMAMSFASHHLWMHWKRPAEWLARRFTDFEPGIHYPQAQRQSGASGMTSARICNPVKQSQEQDPDGIFIRQWVPELANLPTEFIHAPWTAPAHVLIESGVTLGSTYPQPVIDHVQAARQARSKINAAQRPEASASEVAAKTPSQPRQRKPVTSFQKHRHRVGKQPVKRQARQLSLDLEAPHPASNNLY